MKKMNKFRQDRDQFGKWRIIKCLGSGGNGEVHLWQNTTTRQKIAVKSMKFSPDLNEKDKKRWRDEIQFSRQINHENIVRGLVVEPEDFAAYLLRRYPPEPLIMEYCEKGDLRKKINAKENINGLPEVEIRNIVNCLRDALVYMRSKSITHRDLKPENLVIKEENGRDVYKLTDLGYARVINATIEASHVGTFEYFAPEVITEPNYSYTVDYWSFGIIVFEIICGVRPFLPGSPIKQFIEKIRAKSSQTIAITKSSETNEIVNHSTLFDQNHISLCLKQHLERWLRIPLEVEPRQRDVVVGDVTLKPPANLKLFRDLDYILAVKILTVFCLRNFRLYSYTITENTTRQGFLETLSLDTNIPVDDLVIVLPPENDGISRFMATSRPIQLYINELFDKPMVYCTTDKDTLKDTSPNVGMSTLLSRALEDNQLINAKHAVEVSRHLIFYVQLQERYSNLFLVGLRSYALMVDDWILKYRKKFDETSSLFWRLQGVMESHSIQVEHAKRMIAEKNIGETLIDDSKPLMERCGDIRLLFEKTRSRYESVLRRSNSEIRKLNENFSSYMDNIDVKPIYEFYDKLRDRVSSENLSDIATNMFERLNEFHEAIWFLHSAEIKNVQTTISEIHVEFEMIEKIVDNLQNKERETLTILHQKGCILNESLWELGRNAAPATDTSAVDVDGLNIPDLDVLSTNSMNGIDLSLMNVSNDAQRILDRNNALCERFQRLLSGSS